MRRTYNSLLTAILTCAIWTPGDIQPAAAAAKLDTAKIEQLTGAKGTFDEKEGVFKVSAPRGDLSVTVAGVKMTPPMGLTSWAAFKAVGTHTMVMGDMT